MPGPRLFLPAPLLGLAAACDDNTDPEGGSTTLQATQVSSVVPDDRFFRERRA